MNAYPRIYKLLLLLLLLVTLHPATTSAYDTTAQQAVTADGSLGVFTIDFSFGHSLYDVYMPVQAVKSTVALPQTLSYEVLDETGKIATGETHAIVLSNQKYHSGEYVVPKGIEGHFTLLVLFKPDQSETGHRFVTQVTSLPFSFNGSQLLKLNPSELQYYLTPSLKLY